MSLIKKLLTLSFSLITILILLNFKTVPTGKLWNEYTVLYAPIELNQKIINDTLIQNNITNFVYSENQFIPKKIDINSVEYSMMSLNKNTSKYLSLRNNFFHDSSKQYNLFYINNEYKDNLNNCIKSLEKDGYSIGVDSSSSYPILLPIIFIFIFIILLVFAKNKIVFFIPSIIPFIYVVCNPFYSCAIGSIFLIMSVFIISNLWEREGYKQTLLHNKDFLLFSIIGFICASSNSGFSCLFFLLCFIATFCLIYFIKLIQNSITSKLTYTFVLIRPARRTNIYSNKFKLIIFSLIACVFLSLGYFILNSTQTFGASFARILLPAESRISSKELITLDDFCKWDWDVTTLPFRSLNKSEENSISYPKYIKENDEIKQIDYKLKYDESYKNNVIENIDSLNFNSIEKVLKSQGLDKVYGYTASSSYTVSIFSIIMLIVSLGVLLFIYFSVIIKKGVKK